MHQIFRNATCGDSSGVYRTDTLIRCFLFCMIFRQFWKLSCHQAVLNDPWVMLDWYICPLDTVLGYSFCDMNYFKAVLSAFFTKDTFILINHRLMLHQYISPVAAAPMNAVWYGFYSYSVGSFRFFRLLQWSPGPDWPLEHAWSIQLASDWCPEGRPTHMLLASLEVTSPLC